MRAGHRESDVSVHSGNKTRRRLHKVLVSHCTPSANLFWTVRCWAPTNARVIPKVCHVPSDACFAGRAPFVWRTPAAPFLCHLRRHGPMLFTRGRGVSGWKWGIRRPQAESGRGLPCAHQAPGHPKGVLGPRVPQTAYMLHHKKCTDTECSDHCTETCPAHAFPLLAPAEARTNVGQVEVGIGCRG